MNGLASAGLITMDEASCIESTEAGKLMSVYYIDLETMKLIMKIEGTETLEQLVCLICESHELSDMHLRVDERRCLNALNRSSAAATIRYPMKGKIASRQMKLNCVIQAVLGCLPIPDPSLNQEAMKIMRTALRVSKCLVAYTTRPTCVLNQPKTFSAVLNSIILTKCLSANLWENSPYVSKQLKGIGPAFSMLLASAGKTNFLLLEESHPRDLERIMNKGPPAGNIIRKQISLLPKYQLTITPIDRDRIRIELSLLNLTYLSENLEHFTAGVNHKSYIIVGDSENYLLYLISFKDTDLIKIYDGCIKCEVTRKHEQEHKIMAYCVSSSFVGIDVQSEYLFLNIGPNDSNSITNNNEDITTQVNATDAVQKATSANRKRKLNENKNVMSCKKIKTDNTLLNNFKSFRETFGKGNKDILKYFNESDDSNKILQNLSQSKSNNEGFESIISNKTNTTNVVKCSGKQDSFVNNSGKQDSYEHFENDELVNKILNQIEHEMDNVSSNHQLQKQQYSLSNDENKNDTWCNRRTNKLKIPQKHGKCNFSFIDALQDRDVNIHNEGIFDNNDIQGFTNTVKFGIDKYIQKAQITKNKYKEINELLEIENKEEANIKDNTVRQQNDTVVVQHLAGCSNDYKNGVLNENKTRIEDKKPIFKNNSIKESNMEHIKATFQDDIIERKEYEHCENIKKYNFTNNSKDHVIAIASPESKTNCNKILSLSSLVVKEDEKSDDVESLEGNFIVKEGIPLNHNITYKESNDNLITHESDKKIYLNNKNIERQVTLYKDFSHVSNSISLNQNVAKMLQSTDIHINRCSDQHKQNKIKQNIELCEGTQHARNTIITSSPCLVTTILTNSANLENNCESNLIDTNKLCLENCGEKNIDSFNAQRQGYNVQDEHNNSFDNHLYTPENDKKDTQMERYCFRGTKIDVHTKNDSKHTVKIIRKMKIDLDITKIITTKEGNTSAPAPVVSDTKNSNFNNNKSIYPKFIFEETNIKRTCSNLPIPQGSQDTVESKTYVTDILEPKTNSDSSIRNKTNHNYPKFMVKQENDIIRTCSNAFIQYGTQDAVESHKFNSESVKPETTQCKPTSSNKIEDIIKKYSKIISSSNPIIEVPNVIQTKKDNDTKSPIEKPNRRYAISDIQNIQGFIPKQDDQKLVILKKQLMENNQDIFSYSDFSRNDPSSDIGIDIPDKAHPIETPLKKYSSEKNNNSYEKNNIIFKKSIFNTTSLITKTSQDILENEHDNNDIILPPPPEFADFTINLQNPINSTNAYTPLSPKHDPQIQNYDVEGNRSVYDTKTYSQVDLKLRPSNDIATSADFPVHNTQMFNVTQKPTETYIGNPYNFGHMRTIYNNNSRKNKLDKFEFKRKNLLKFK